MKRMTTNTMGMMTTRSRCAVVLVSSAVAVTPPTKASASASLTATRSDFTASSASIESAAEFNVALIRTLPSRTAGSAGVPGAPVIGTLPSASR